MAKILIIVVLVLGIGIGGFTALNNYYYEIPCDKVEISDLCMLHDGSIAFRVTHDNGCGWSYLRDNASGGKAYVWINDTIFHEKTSEKLKYYDYVRVSFDYLYNTYETGDEEITQIYYGTNDENILIWEKGMDIPDASPEVEEHFAY